MARNILVATLGQSWAVVPESLWLFLPHALPSPQRTDLQQDSPALPAGRAGNILPYRCWLRECG